MNNLKKKEDGSYTYVFPLEENLTEVEKEKMKREISKDLVQAYLEILNATINPKPTIEPKGFLSE